MLAGSAVLLLILCYQFSFSRAMVEYNSFKEQKEVALQGRHNVSVPLLESKSRMLDNLLDQFVLDTLDESKNLLGITGNYCSRHEVRLKEYKPYPVKTADSLQILTRSITVEGSFKDCLNFVYELESKFKAGRVSSVLFKSFTDPISTRSYLHCSIFIQNIISPFYEKK